VRVQVAEAEAALAHAKTELDACRALARGLKERCEAAGCEATTALLDTDAAWGRLGAQANLQVSARGL